MPSTCCVPGCKSNYKSPDSVRVFKFPNEGTELYNRWMQQLSRQDWKPGPRTVVCILHFREEDVIKNIVAKRPNGTELVMQRKRFKLCEDAVPSIFPSFSKYLSEQSKSTRASLRRRAKCKRRKDGIRSVLERDKVKAFKKIKQRKEELAALGSSQSEPSTSVAEEPPAKVAKISIPKVDPASLIVEGPRQRKRTKPFTPVAQCYENYVFNGKRLVNMGYFIKSLQMLNNHDGRKCNFSNMRVCKEVKDDWNVGIMFTCKLCPSTKVIWLEDPCTKVAPSSPIIVKSQAAVKPNFTVLQPIQTSSYLRAPTATVCVIRKPMVQTKLPVPPPPPQIPKRVRQPYWSKRKTPTPPPDEDTPAGHFLQQQAGSQGAVQMKEVTKYPNTLLIRPSTAVCYGPPQTPFSRQLIIKPVFGQQVPTIAQSVVNQSPPVNQPKVSVIGQTQLIGHLRDSVTDPSQAPLIDLPQVIPIKQELILPDDGSSSLINSSLESARVEMTFCVDQGENTTALESVSSDTYTAMTKDNTITPDAHTLTSVHSSSSQLCSSSAMDVDRTCGIGPTDALPVDLNLVKKEVEDEI